MPALFIITGSNGAGKSALGFEYVPLELKNAIFDGDKLFMQKKSEFYRSGIRPHKECKKLALQVVEDTFEQLVEASLSERKDLAYEGHFTNDATWDIPKKFMDAGYDIHLIFFGLTDTHASRVRVVARSEEGGHYVDDNTIALNFYGNLQKLDIYFSLFDSVDIWDTAGIHHKLVEIKKGIPVAAVASIELPEWFTNNLTSITNKIIETENHSE